MRKDGDNLNYGRQDAVDDGIGKALKVGTARNGIKLRITFRKSPDSPHLKVQVGKKSPPESHGLAVIPVYGLRNIGGCGSEKFQRAIHD